MTDNEIIKALRCCSRTDKTVWCPDCPLFGREETDCLPQKAKAALDLINRQKAEIEELRADNNYLFETMPRIKTEAIKEFAERLKQYNIGLYSEFKAKIINEDIDTLLKEMTEQRKEDEGK